MEIDSTPPGKKLSCFLTLGYLLVGFLYDFGFQRAGPCRARPSLHTSVLTQLLSSTSLIQRRIVMLSSGKFTSPPSHLQTKSKDRKENTWNMMYAPEGSRTPSQFLLSGNDTSTWHRKAACSEHHWCIFTAFLRPFCVRGFIYSWRITCI
jgi:hypothetical protein